ncbi:MAG: hypothetical protein H7Y42_07740 [Chitinophagaceae bacterium]|nr:hypothetical protein [Chitinophagaceae bacterium]
MNWDSVRDILSALSIGAIIVVGIQWARFKKNDKAREKKTLAEAHSIESTSWSTGWQGVIDSMRRVHSEEREFLNLMLQNERTRFEKLLDQERIDCDIRMEIQRQDYDEKIGMLNRQVQDIKNHIK